MAYCDLPCPHCGEFCADVPDEKGVPCPHCGKDLSETPKVTAVPQLPPIACGCFFCHQPIKGKP